MIKILHYVSLMNRAGQETFIMNVFKTIDPNVISFDFLCSLPGKGDYDDDIHSLGGEIYHIDLSKRQTKLKQVDNFFILYNYLKSVKKKYEAFHIHTQHAMDGYQEALAAKIAGFPMVIVHSHSTNTLFHIKAHMLFRKLLNHLDITRLACSDLAGKWLYGESGKYEVIHNGIDIQQYRFHKEIRDRLRKQYKWNDKLIIGHVGSFTYPKNHEFILDVFNEILKINSNAYLVFAGEGELSENIIAKCEILNIKDHVTFLGIQNNINEVDQAYDVMLFPSRYEGLPIALVEAQCTGLPCVISDTITAEVEITDRVIRLNLLKDNPKVWAKKVLEVVKENESTDRESAYLFVKKNGYNMVETINKLTQIYCRKSNFQGEVQ